MSKSRTLGNVVGLGEATILLAGSTAQRPASPLAGMLRFNTDDAGFEGYDGTEWGTIAGGSSVVVSDTPPVDAEAGDMWWDTEDGILKLYYFDGATTQWVEASPSNNIDLSLYYTSAQVDAAIAANPSSYNLWSVKTGAYTASSGDQVAANGTFTVTLPASPSAGNTVIIANVGSGTITVGRNGENINSGAEDGTLNADSSAQLVYIDATIGWKEI